MPLPSIAFAALLVAAMVGGLAGCGEPARPTVNFHRALHSGDLDQIKRHLYWGAEANLPGPDGDYPLHVVARQGGVVVVRQLLKHGARIDVRDAADQTPLHVALAHGRIPVAQLLSRQGAHDDPQALLHALVTANRLDRDVLTFLIEQGADVNQLGPDGRAPLHLAVAAGDTRLTRRLLEAGAEANRADAHGATPLGIAGGDSILVRLLEQFGAAP